MRSQKEQTKGKAKRKRETRKTKGLNIKRSKFLNIIGVKVQKS